MAGMGRQRESDAKRAPTVDARDWIDRWPQANFRPMAAYAHPFAVAPMMDWTDRHCRFFHRLLTRRVAPLYRVPSTLNEALGRATFAAAKYSDRKERRPCGSP
jgi:hypothetical protein